MKSIVGGNGLLLRSLSLKEEIIERALEKKEKKKKKDGLYLFIHLSNRMSKYLYLSGRQLYCKQTRLFIYLSENKVLAV